MPIGCRRSCDCSRRRDLSKSAGAEQCVRGLVSAPRRDLFAHPVTSRRSQNSPLQLFRREVLKQVCFLDDRLLQFSAKIFAPVSLSALSDPPARGPGRTDRLMDANSGEFPAGRADADNSQGIFAPCRAVCPEGITIFSIGKEISVNGQTSRQLALGPGAH